MLHGSRISVDPAWYSCVSVLTHNARTLDQTVEVASTCSIVHVGSLSPKLSLPHRFARESIPSSQSVSI